MLDGLDLIKMNGYSDDCLPCNLDDQFGLTEYDMPKTVVIDDEIEVTMEFTIDGWVTTVSVPDDAEVVVEGPDDNE